MIKGLYIVDKISVSQLGGGAKPISPPPHSAYFAPALTRLQHDHDCGLSFIKFCQLRKKIQKLFFRACFAHYF